MEDRPHGATVLRSVEGLGGRSPECPAGAGSASGFRANGPPAQVRSRRGSKQEVNRPGIPGDIRCPRAAGFSQVGPDELGPVFTLRLPYA